MTRNERWQFGLATIWAGGIFLCRERPSLPAALLTAVSGVGMGVAAILTIRERRRAKRAA